MNKKILLGLLLFFSLISVAVASSNVSEPQLSGWENPEFNAAIDSSGKLKITAPGTLTTDYTFDVFANHTYRLSYVLSQKSQNSCTVTADFVDGLCLSGDDFVYTKCFKTPKEGLIPEDDFIDLFIPLANPKATNKLYFKDVRLRLTFTGECSDVMLYNLSLKESSYIADAINYDYSKVPNRNITTESSCCPNDYCFNGTTCVAASIWNSPLEKGIWSKGDKSYRCVITKDGSAEWVFSMYKYDWNNENKGYCPKITDCFVSSSSPQIPTGCVAHDTLVNDNFEITNSSNHYCYNGSWTTKTYLVAKLLLGLKGNSDYVLHCYNDSSITFNPNGIVTKGNFNDKVSSSCVLIKKNSDTDDHIVSAIIPKEGQDNAVMNYVSSGYSELTYKGITPKASLTSMTVDKCVLLSNSNFSECFISASTQAPLFVYYENNFKYFLISDQKIVSMYPPTAWDLIITFFKKILGSNTGSNPFTNMPLTDYENIYLASNSKGTVIAVEEDKYDLSRGKNMTVLVINYNCSNLTYNSLNKEEIINYINTTFSKYGAVNVSDIVITSNLNTQNISITTEMRTDLWAYFTSSLRYRNVDLTSICP